MRMMTPKVYGPRDLREAYRMPREDAVWIMEHCAEVWEADRVRLEELQAYNAALRQLVLAALAGPPEEPNEQQG